MLKNLRFSPRGTGGSTNLYCGSKEEAPFVANPTADRSLENVAAQLERGRLIAEACARELLKHCGPERLLWGSDWPFAAFEDKATYADCVAAFKHCVPDESARRIIGGETPMRLYFI